MAAKTNFFRAISNTFLSLCCAGWILLLAIVSCCLLEEPACRQEHLLSKSGQLDHLPSLRIAQISLIVAGLVLAILVAFFVFVYTNKLWSFKAKPEDVDSRSLHFDDPTPAGGI